MTYYFHYTNEAGYLGIQKSGFIKESVKLDDGDDAFYGNGVYLTTVAPKEGKNEIISVCWSPNFITAFLKNGRVDYVFEIKIPSNVLKKAVKKPRVFLHKGNLILANFEWKAYKV